MRVAGKVTKQEPCPLGREGWRTTRWPGSRDQCPGCGRTVYTRADGTCEPHLKPVRKPDYLKED